MSYLSDVAEMGIQMEDGKLQRGARLPCSDWPPPELPQPRGKGRAALPHQLWQLMVGWVHPLKLLLLPLPQTGKLSPFLLRFHNPNKVMEGLIDFLGGKCQMVLRWLSIPIFLQKEKGVYKIIPGNISTFGPIFIL